MDTSNSFMNYMLNQMHCAKQRKPNSHVVCNPTFYRQKTNWWLPTSRHGGESATRRHEGTFAGDGTGLYLSCGGCYITECIC